MSTLLHLGGGTSQWVSAVSSEGAVDLWAVQFCLRYVVGGLLPCGTPLHVGEA